MTARRTGRKSGRESRADRDESTAVEERPRTARPLRWRVLIHNDDYTTMDFVVLVLIRHFHKSPAEATHVMLQVHHRGSGVAGVYTRDVAESKLAAVADEAEREEQPLRLSLEPE